MLYPKHLLTGPKIDIQHCTFLVDSQSRANASVLKSMLEPDFIDDSGDGRPWEKIECRKFLDVGATHSLARIFWVPDWEMIPRRYRRQWGRYCLLRRR